MSTLRSRWPRARVTSRRYIGRVHRLSRYEIHPALCSVHSFERFIPLLRDCVVGASMLSSRSSCRYILTAAVILFTLLLFGAQLRSSTSWTDRLIPGLPTINGGFTPELPCHDLPGANETLVVLKTGAGEIEEKLPIHLNTTFRCYPNTVIFSDFG